MIYICEKCRMVYKADFEPIECETCGCTLLRKADDKEIADIIGSMFLDGGESILLKEEGSAKHHR